MTWTPERFERFTIYDVRGKPSRGTHSWWALGMRSIRPGRVRRLLLGSRVWGGFTRRYSGEILGSSMTLADQRRLYEDAAKLRDVPR